MSYLAGDVIAISGVVSSWGVIRKCLFGDPGAVSLSLLCESGVVRTQLHQAAFVQGLLKIGERRPKHVEALHPNETKKLRKRIKLVFDLLL
jgi:hypothetical protein